jgi:hypothetical protein
VTPSFSTSGNSHCAKHVAAGLNDAVEFLVGAAMRRDRLHRTPIRPPAGQRTDGSQRRSTPVDQDDRVGLDARGQLVEFALDCRQELSVRLFVAAGAFGREGVERRLECRVLGQRDGLRA